MSLRGLFTKLTLRMLPPLALIPLDNRALARRSESGAQESSIRGGSFGATCFAPSSQWPESTVAASKSAGSSCPAAVGIGFCFGAIAFDLCWVICFRRQQQMNSATRRIKTTVGRTAASTIFILVLLDRGEWFSGVDGVNEATEVAESDLAGAVTVAVYVREVVADPDIILIRRFSSSRVSPEAAYNAIYI